jgi:4-hydroxy-2-oxoheptanedioate aldolase
MLNDRLRTLWQNGGAATNIWLSSASPLIAEIVARSGVDSVTIDMQHGMNDFSDVLGMLQAVTGTGCVPFVRVPWNEPGIVMKTLDAGAHGVIVPMINTRAEAESFVAACRYPPQGFRSYGPTRAAQVFGRDYVERANEEVLKFIMIETAEGLANLDDICATPGLNGIYIGPADLSYALGLSPGLDKTDTLHVETVRRIITACRQHGLYTGMMTDDTSFGRGLIAQGIQLLTIGTDIRCLTADIARRLVAFRG